MKKNIFAWFNLGYFLLGVMVGLIISILFIIDYPSVDDMKYNFENNIPMSEETLISNIKNICGDGLTINYVNGNYSINIECLIYRGIDNEIRKGTLC